MAHEINIQGPAHNRVSGAATLALTGALLLVIGGLALSDVTPDGVATRGGVEPVAEDWHGNVRRSYGVY